MISRMQIWGSYIRRKSNCAFVECSDLIQAGDVVVRGKRFRNDGKSHRFAWHPQCYIDQLIQYVQQTEFSPMPSGPGRPKLDLSTEDKRKRRNLLARAYNLRKEKEIVVKYGIWSRFSVIEKQQQGIIEEIKNVGGVPRSW